MASRFFAIGSALLLLATVATAQLSFHNDPSQNSFQIRTPGFQQSFTRYFNGQQGSLFAAQQQSQPQYAPLPHQQQQANPAYSYQGQQYQQQQQQHQQAQQPYSRFTSQFGAASAANGEPQYTTVQDNYINPNIRQAIQQQRLSQQQQQYQPQVEQQQQQQPQQPQQQYYSQEDITAYLQNQQAAQAQYYAQQQPQANPQSQYEYVQQQQLQQQQLQQQQYDANQQQLQQQQQQQQQQDPSADATQATHNKLIGVAFSPSNEVSQVKFNGNGLKYNF